METKWMWISLAVAFSSMMFAISFDSNNSPTKYESFNAAVARCLDYYKVENKNACLQIVKETYQLDLK